ncbi:hypothetical protein M8J77_003757 [Diaphorina citri]|nr:hypothetical protein M8J77_003757 [Diaphorina citri]
MRRCCWKSRLSHFDSDHQYPTRGGNRHLLVPRVDHSSYYYIGVVYYNQLPALWRTMDRDTFENILREKLMVLEPYSLQEFLEAGLT